MESNKVTVTQTKAHNMLKMKGTRGLLVFIVLVLLTKLYSTIVRNVKYNKNSGPSFVDPVMKHYQLHINLKLSMQTIVFSNKEMSSYPILKQT